MPSKASAIATIRDATRPFFSRRASLRKLRRIMTIGNRQSCSHTCFSSHLVGRKNASSTQLPKGSQDQSFQRGNGMKGAQSGSHHWQFLALLYWLLCAVKLNDIQIVFIGPNAARGR